MSYLEGLVAGSLGVVWDLTGCCPNSPELTNMHVESIHLMTAISKAEELGLLGAPEGRLDNRHNGVIGPEHVLCVDYS